MYYNKQRVEHQMDNGIEDAAGTIEELHGFISKMVDEMRGRQLEIEMEDFIEEWEAEE